MELMVLRMDEKIQEQQRAGLDKDGDGAQRDRGGQLSNMRLFALAARETSANRRQRAGRQRLDGATPDYGGRHEGAGQAGRR